MSIRHSLSSVFDADPLFKRYDTQFASADVTLSISTGHVVGQLGRNGADKTTFLHLAAGLTPPKRLNSPLPLQWKPINSCC